MSTLTIFLHQKYNNCWKGIFFMAFLGFLMSCNNNPPTQEQETLPNTPETVSKKWQFYLDNNQLDKVALLSTSSTKEWLEENRELFLNDHQVYKTQFIKMKCQTNGNQATCNFTIKEEGELIDDYFLLKKVAGQWLVDIEEDTISPELEEQIFREMERELKMD